MSLRVIMNQQQMTYLMQQVINLIGTPVEWVTLKNLEKLINKEVRVLDFPEQEQ